MSKQWITVPSSLLLVFVLPLIAYFFFIWHDAPQAPAAKQGILDLSGWNFRDSGAARLTGEWEFYGNRLLLPEDFAEEGAAPVPDAIVKVPGKWNAYIDSKGMEGTGAATYRLRLRLGERESGIFGIHTDIIRTANRIFMNGQELGASGRPSLTRQEGIAGNKPYTGFLEVDSGSVDLIVQVSNYNYYSGGIITPILFGDYASIARLDKLQLISDALTAFVFAIFAFYFLGLNRRYNRDASPIYLGGLCAAALLYILTHGQKLLCAFAPGLPYEIVLKIQMISSTLVYFFLLKYVAVSLPRTVHPFVIKLGSGLTVFQIGMTFLLPGILFSKWEPGLLFFGSACLGYVMYAILRGAKAWPNRQFLMLTGGLSLLAIIMAFFLGITGFHDSNFFAVYEIILFVLVQTVILSIRHSDSVMEVKRLSTRLLTLDGMKDEFIVNVSHELRTPLHAIINIADSLLHGTAGRLTKEQADHVAMVASAGKRLSLLIDGILDFTRVRNGSVLLHPRPLQLPDIVRSVWEVLSLTAAPKELAFVQRWPDKLPPVYMDEDRLQQILYIILNNALTFTPQGQIIVSAGYTAHAVTLTVEDTGIGMDGERLQTIFTAFDPGAALSGKPNPGTGISLSLAKELITLAGGHIWAESRPGAGSRFHVTLPAAMEETARREAAASGPLLAGAVVGGVAAGADPASARREAAAPEPLLVGAGVDDAADGGAPAFTVMIVDDDPVNRKVLEALLTVDRYDVMAARNGREALALLHEGPSVDLVIVDWMMPGMSGLALCRLIRERYMLSELPVLMLTARSGPEDIQAGFQAGVNDFLSKPVNAGELRARVRTLLELRRSVQTYIRTEMAFLQAQIKPHFLYNALNSIIAVCPDDPDKTMELLYSLSRYLRGSFEFHNQDQFIPLAGELELVEAYVELEKARFEDRLRVVYDIDSGLQALIPPLSIQPIVENAVRHGIMQNPEGGTVELRVVSEADRLSVAVRDDGIGMPQERADALLGERRTGKGVGLQNIHRRLLALNGSGLRIESKAGEGTTVRFELPMSTMR